MMNSVERYYVKKQRRKKRAKVAFFGLLFVLFILTLTILSMTVFFNAETIIVEGNSRYSAAQILEEGDLKVGQNLFRLDKFKVIERMKKLPYVKDVTIRRQLPSKLKITVVENTPVVWASTPSGAALLNEYYRVLEYVDYTPPAEPPETPPEEAEEPEATAEPEEAEESEESEKPEESGEPAESGEPEAPVEEPAAELPEKLKNLARLTQVEIGAPEVGATVVFPEEADYTGFLERLYQAFEKNPELDWSEVSEVRFNARYDISLVYHQTVTIEFGSLDQADTKVELAAYLLKDNGMSQTAVLDVSDVERVYYRPQK